MPEIKIEQELFNNKDNFDIMRELSLNLNKSNKSKSNSPESKQQLNNENFSKKYHKLKNEADNTIKMKLKLNNFKQKVINCYNLNIPIENG